MAQLSTTMSTRLRKIEPQDQRATAFHFLISKRFLFVVLVVAGEVAPEGAAIIEIIESTFSVCYIDLHVICGHVCDGIDRLKTVPPEEDFVVDFSAPILD